MTDARPTLPRVDVGVVTWNTRDLTVECLRRLLDSDQGVNLRLFVHDNNSSDGTVSALAREVPEADVEVAPANLGFSAGVNRLIARTEAPWFVTLNSDAWPETQGLSRLVHCAERFPQAAAVAPRVESPDGHLEHTTQAFPRPATALPLAIPGYQHLRPESARRLMLPGAWQHDYEREVDWAIGATLLFRRTALESLGGLDERLFMYAEDLDWCWRAHESGWVIRFEPSAIVRHVGNASGRKRYGTKRDVVSLSNSYRVAAWHQGRGRTAMTYLLFVLWTAVRLLLSKPRSTEAARWRAQLHCQMLAGRAVYRQPDDEAVT